MHKKHVSYSNNFVICMHNLKSWITLLSGLPGFVITHYAEYAPWQLKTKVCQYLICREKTNKHNKHKIKNNTGISVFTRLVKIAIAVVLLYNAYVLQSSTVSRKSEALIVRYSQKKELICFVFYCFERTLQLVILNFRTTGPIQVRFSAKCTSPMSTSIK